MFMFACNVLHVPPSPPLLPLSLSIFCRSTTHTPTQLPLSLSTTLPLERKSVALGKKLTVFNHAQIALLPLHNLLQIQQVHAKLLDFARIKVPRVGRCLVFFSFLSFICSCQKLDFRYFLFPILIITFLYFPSITQQSKHDQVCVCLCVDR